VASFGVEFRPLNPEGWPRLEGSTRVALEGVAGSGSVARDVSLASSALDVLIASRNGALYLAPARGDGGFAAPRVFATSGGGEAPLIAVRRIDPITRSSVLVLEGGRFTLHLNDGIRGFRATLASVPADRAEDACSLDAADIDNDGWMEVLFGLRGAIGVIAGLRQALATPQVLVSWKLDVATHIANDPLTVLLATPALLAPSDREQFAGYSPIAVAGWVSGRAATLVNLGAQGFAEPEWLPGAAELDLVSEPAAWTVGQVGSGLDLLVLAKRQQRKLGLWARSGFSWQALPELPLPFAPEILALAPTRTGGIVVGSSWTAGAPAVVAVVLWETPRSAPLILPVHRAAGPVRLSALDDCVALADREQQRVLVYR
jgi:hypothetical protein